MSDSDALRGLRLQVDALQRELAALRTRTNRAAIVAVVVVLAAGGGIYSLADDAKDTAAFAQANSTSGFNQANVAYTEAVKARSAVQQLRSEMPSPTGPSSPPLPPAFSPVVRPGHVAATTGVAPVAVGDSCTVTVVPNSGGGDLNCQITVRCADEMIYGGTRLGYLVCGMVDGQPSFGRDNDTGADPKLELDLAGNRVVVEDGPSPAFTVTVEL